jgi:hypothetical protein
MLTVESTGDRCLAGGDGDAGDMTETGAANGLEKAGEEGRGGS